MRWWLIVVIAGCGETALPGGGDPEPDVAQASDVGTLPDEGASADPDVSSPAQDIAADVATDAAHDVGGKKDTKPSCPPAPECDDQDPCTNDAAVGPGEDCIWECNFVPIAGCCGNGVVEEGETCDGDCPICDDGDPCTGDAAEGAPKTCDVVCTVIPGDPGVDSDGDTLTDCVEATDDRPFTDPGVFNGLWATMGEPPYGALSSAQCDLFFGEDYGQMLLLFDESDQAQAVWAGWGYSAGKTNDYDDPEHYDFEPNWSHSKNGGVYNSFQVWFSGRFYADQAGTWCFSVDTGSGGLGPGDIAGRKNACGRVYVNAEPTSQPLAETGYGAAASPHTGCVALEAGEQAIDIAARHYESYFYAPRLQVRHCFGGPEACTPDLPLTMDVLQVP